MHTAEQYRDQLLALQPPGDALPGDPGSNWVKLLLALADEFARVETRGEALLEEADPNTTVELLPDWERVVGLPDTCVPGDQTSEQRRNALVARIARTGGISRQHLIDAAAYLGYTITITEFLPHSVDSDVDYPLYGADWAFAIQVNAPSITVHFLTVDSDVDAPLAWWGNEQLECTMRRNKPGGRFILFAYA